MERAVSAMDVLARFYDSLDEDDDLTWIQYLQEHADASPLPGKSTPGRGAPIPMYNPYDYTNLSDRPKRMNDGPPFSQTYDEMGAEYGVSYSPKIFYDENGVLHDWYKARRTDWTQDPTEQQPAISIDRRYASMEREAATLNEVVNKDFHYTNDRKLARSAEVGIRPLKSSQDAMLKGFFEFTWNNRTPMDGEPRVVFQFLRPAGKRRPKSYLDYPVQMACNCKSFLYFGAQYYAVHGKYMYMPMFRPSLVPPVPQTMISRVAPGKGINFRVCKHVLAAYRWFETQNLRILMHYRRYPQIGPPAKVMNAKEWERLMGFPFDLDEIKRKLSGRKLALPRFFRTNFFRNKQQSAELEQWFQDTWVNRNEAAKLRVLETLVEHPEEIFYLLVKDAMEAPNKISPSGIEKAYELMSRVVQPDNKEEPEGKTYKRPGTRAVIPGKELDEEEVKPEDESTYKKVEPSTKDKKEKGDDRFGIKPKRTPEQEALRQRARKTLRPWLKRESSEDSVITMYLDSLEAA